MEIILFGLSVSFTLKIIFSHHFSSGGDSCCRIFVCAACYPKYRAPKKGKKEGDVVNGQLAHAFGEITKSKLIAL
jgi:hypothetical protein